MIPVLGIVTWALVGVFGLGCATMSFAATLRRERPARPPKPTKASSVDEPPPAPPVPEAPPPFVPPAVPPSTPAFGAPGASAQAVDLALYPRASFLDRTAALALDVVLMAIVNAVLRYPWNDGGFLVVVLAYQIGFMAWRGTTLGASSADCVSCAPMALTPLCGRGGAGAVECLFDSPRSASAVS
jgi:hypothetical protein